jgi:hypothetical protein
MKNVNSGGSYLLQPRIMDTTNLFYGVFTLFCSILSCPGVLLIEVVSKVFSCWRPQSKEVLCLWKRKKREKIRTCAMVWQLTSTRMVECSDGSEVYCKYFIPCIGFASPKFAPPFKGLSDFEGDIYHTAIWRQRGIKLKKQTCCTCGNWSLWNTVHSRNCSKDRTLYYLPAMRANSVAIHEQD